MPKNVGRQLKNPFPKLRRPVNNARKRWVPRRRRRASMSSANAIKRNKDRKEDSGHSIDEGTLVHVTGVRRLPTSIHSIREPMCDGVLIGLPTTRGTRNTSAPSGAALPACMRAAPTTGPSASLLHQPIPAFMLHLNRVRGVPLDALSKRISSSLLLGELHV